MVHWMDHVDSTLRTILHEVNTLEEFEKEKTIFQVSIGQFHIFLYHVIEIFKYFASPFLRSLRIAPDFDGKYTRTSMFFYSLGLLCAQSSFWNKIFNE